ncbi:MAG TPA: TolC family protein [Halanaerobiales bacterium]|nr:TolC family protein [Halanaerobiales bacterium]
MRKSKILITVFTLLIITTTVFTAAAEELSLEQAVQKFVNNSNQLENAKRDIKSSELDLELAKKGLAPEVTLQTSYTRLTEAPEAPSEYVLQPSGQTTLFGQPLPKYKFIPVTFEEQPQDNYNTTLTLNKPLYLGGQVRNSVNLSEKAVQLNNLKYEQSLNDNLNAVVQSYFNVLIKESLVEIQKNSLKLVQSHLDSVQKNYEAGLVVKSDVNEVKIEENKTKQSIMTAENDLKIAKKRLADLLELDNTDFSLKQPSIPELEEKLQSQLDKAYANRFEMKSLEINQEMKDINKEMEDNLFKPSFFLRGNYSFQGSDLSFDNGSFSVTLSGQVSLYDGNKSDLKQEKVDLEKANIDNNKEQLKKNIETEIMAALYKIDENRESLEIARQNEEQALENYNQAVKRYENGVGTSLDVLRAETNLSQIQISKNQTHYQYIMSIYSLLHKTGTLNNYFEEVIQSENQ